MKEGRFWTDGEDQRHAHVCVVAHDTAEELFGDADPIGKDVNVASSLFTVIGVLEKRKQPFGSGKNPETTASSSPSVSFITSIPN